MASKMSVRARFAGEMRFEVAEGSGHAVVLDGDHVAGYSPMEMLLASLAGCSAMSVIAILQKKREDVRSYEVFVEGVRAETHPMVFVEIVVEHVITGRGVRKASVERAIELAETRYCGVSIMLGRVTRLVHTYRIVQEGEHKEE